MVLTQTSAAEAQDAEAGECHARSRGRSRGVSRQCDRRQCQHSRNFRPVVSYTLNTSTPTHSLRLLRQCEHTEEVTMPLPTCPRSTTGTLTHSVKTVSGAGGRRRTYQCTCGCVWNQICPDALARDEDPGVTERHHVHKIHGGEKRSGGYKCGICGQKKAKHVCNPALKRGVISAAPHEGCGGRQCCRVA